MTTSQITVGVHIGWITSLSRRGPSWAQDPLTSLRTPTPGGRLGHAAPGEIAGRKRSKEPVCAPTDFRAIVHEPDPAGKHFSLHDDPPRVLLDHALADAVHLLQILRLLERPVGIPVVDDLLRPRSGTTSPAPAHPAIASSSFPPPSWNRDELLARFHAAGRARSMPTISDGRMYLVVGGGVERVEVGLPLPDEQRLLPGIAVLAGGHHVGADRAAAPHQRDHVIERQGLRADRAPAVVAEARRDAPPPPRGLAELARPRLLAAQGVVVHLARVAIVAHRSSPATVESRSDSSSHSFMSQATRSSVSLRDWAMSRAFCPSR